MQVQEKHKCVKKKVFSQAGSFYEGCAIYDDARRAQVHTIYLKMEITVTACILFHIAEHESFQDPVSRVIMGQNCCDRYKKRSFHSHFLLSSLFKLTNREEHFHQHSADSSCTFVWIQSRKQRSLKDGLQLQGNLLYISQQIHTRFSECCICRLCVFTSVATCW